MSITLLSLATQPIRLGQALKLADIAQDGLEAKLLIQQGEILVNGEAEYRRGRQLYEGDIIEHDKQRIQLILS